MSRLSARKLAGTGAALLASAGLGLAMSQGPEGASAAPGRYVQPNIVLVMTDDQALSQMGRRVMPKVNRLLRDHGTRFKNAFLTTPCAVPRGPPCSPASMGTTTACSRTPIPPCVRSGNVLPAWLRRAGYVTAHVGKFLNRYHHDVNQAAVAPGWDRWYTQLDGSEDAYYDWDLSRNGKRIH
jgi:arylsulfatase A-like enzyme